MTRRLQMLGGIGVAVLLATHGGYAADQLQLRVLSSRPDMVTGGDALVRVELPRGVAARDVKLTVNGPHPTPKLKADPAGPPPTGLRAMARHCRSSCGSKPARSTAASIRSRWSRAAGTDA